MKLSFVPFDLELKHEFNISYHSRRSTPIVLVRLEQNGLFGYGEASLPPYLPENTQTVINFLQKVKLVDINTYSDLVEAMQIIDSVDYDNTAAKAAVDIALHDLLGKLKNIGCFEFYGIKSKELPFTSFTIGIDREEIIRTKIIEAEPFKILKIKLGGRHDKEIVRTIRQMTDKQLYVDANQGWTDKNYAFDMIEWLKDQNAILIEQPMPKSNFDDTAWLKEISPLPIIADEAFQGLVDIDNVKDSYHGINIKLMKCGGIREGYLIIQRAKKLGLKIMLGCMTETSCAISAAIQLAPLVDYIDLDGNLLIKNDPFISKTIDNGRIVMPGGTGLGLELKEDIFR
jgi:L-alanine-DL-glutamate epimerase-like enolase superfamily enzyme